MWRVMEVTSDDKWMLAYAARKQKRRRDVKDAARDEVVERQEEIVEAFSEYLTKLRKHEEPLLVGIGHRSEDDTPPSVRDLCGRSRARDDQ